MNSNKLLDYREQAINDELLRRCHLQIGRYIIKIDQ